MNYWNKIMKPLFLHEVLRLMHRDYEQFSLGNINKKIYVFKVYGNMDRQGSSDP